MRIALRELVRRHRLPRPAAIAYLDGLDWELEIGPGLSIVSGDSACRLGALFYLVLGELRLASGSLVLGDLPPAEDTQRPQQRGIGVLDDRSALWWDRTLLDNVAAVLDGDDAEARARAALERWGVEQGIRDAGLPARWAQQARKQHDPDQRAALEAAAADPLSAEPHMLGDALLHRRAQLAREMAQQPRLLMVLDSCDCAGQASAAPLYPLLAEAAEVCGGGLLFSRARVPVAAAERVYVIGETAEGPVLTEREAASWAGPAAPEPLPDDRRVLVLRDISKRFGGVTVIEDIDIEIERGRVTVIMGGSGCGKSTLLRIIVGIHRPDTGQVLFNRKVDRQMMGLEPIVDRRIEPSIETRKAFGVLFQDGALFNSMTVAQNVSAPILEHTNLHQNVVDLMVQIKLDLVQMLGNDPDHPEHAHKTPAQLSGGQRKRVGLARALALDPQVILYDEPSAGLDPIVSRQIDELIVKLGEVLGVTSVVITHELDSAFTIADKMVVLRKGNRQENEYWGAARMIAQGNQEEIMGCIQPHVMAFLDEFSYHSRDPLGQLHRNWYTAVFAETEATAG